jgi:hypothetical protein
MALRKGTTGYGDEYLSSNVELWSWESHPNIPEKELLKRKQLVLLFLFAARGHTFVVILLLG